MRKILILYFLISSRFLFAGWTNLNTGINDHLTGVYFWGNNGLVSGHHGLYFTSTGGVGPSSWFPFEITGNTTDSLIYEHTKFYHAYADQSWSNTVFVCGEDTVDHKAIIMSITFLPSPVYDIIYIGAPNTSLRNITYSNSFNSFYAVGDNGLIVNFTGLSATVIPSGMSYDFTCINYWNNNYFIGSNGHAIYGVNNANVLTSQVINSPGNSFSGVIPTWSNMASWVGNSLYGSTSGAITEYPYYDFGPLNANCMYGWVGNWHLVGTDHGIFQNNSFAHNYLEYQPSSLHLPIRSFGKSMSIYTYLYACGDNGVVLRTSDGGGSPKPIAFLIAPTGGCVNTYIPLQLMSGSSTSCQWTINGSPIGAGCSGTYSTTYATPNTYNVQVNVTNGAGSYDTAYATFYVINPPQINKPYSISDSILCHSETIQISIDSSQLYTFYTLRKTGSPLSYGSSGSGTGGTISFTTLPLNTSGYYYLQSENDSVECSKNFTDTFHIVVEQTDARYHSTMINVNPGEPVQFMNNSVDAQNFNWSFSPSASVTTSTLVEPITSFGSVGPTNVQLIAWSNNGCYDSTTGIGPQVYIPNPMVDSCWNLLNQAPTGAWSSYYDYYPDIHKMKKGKTGLYICGEYNNPEIFASRYGNTSYIAGIKGGYMEKLDFNGAVKWKIYTNQIPYATTLIDMMYDVAEDDSGNVYVSGRSVTYVHDNSGDSILMVNPSYGGGTPNSFILKLDSLGKVKWKLNCYGYVDMQHLLVDHAGDLLVAGNRQLVGLPMEFILNDSTHYPFTNYYLDSANYFLFKVSPEGIPQWNSEIVLTYLNANGIGGISIDMNNNIYMACHGESWTSFRSAGSPTAIYMPLLPSASITKTYVVKYTQTGNISWIARSHSNMGVTTGSIVTDSVGNSYLTGSNGYYDYFDSTIYVQVLEHSDHSQMEFHGGGYYLAKLNSNGFWQWIEGSLHAAGGGAAVLIDQDEISVVGRINNYLNTPETGIITSADGNSKMINMGLFDFFVSSYDTAGNLSRIVKSGNNTSLAFTPRFKGFFKRPDESYYLGGFMGNFSPLTSIFGSIVDTTWGFYDGFISKFYPGCGIVYIPCYATQTFTGNGCDSVVAPSGNVYYASGVFHDTLYTLTPQCDTSFTLNINVNHATLNDLHVTSCGTYVLNSIPYNSTGMYQQFLINHEGCDSILTLFLIVNSPLVNTIHQSGMSLVADLLTADNYQWINCAGNTPVVGANASTFTPVVSGSYALIVTDNGCTDTSACITITGVGMDEPGNGPLVYAYPNPTTGMVNIYCDNELDDLEIRITDVSGKSVATLSHLHGKSFIVDLSTLPSGIYFAQLFTGNGSQTIKLVKE